ncbi:hypothetical protein V6O07_23600 [Arthrospira platensis SPKY2]
MDIKPLTFNILNTGCYIPAVKVKGNISRELGVKESEVIKLFPIKEETHKLEKIKINEEFIKQEVLFLNKKTDRILNSSYISNEKNNLNYAKIQEIPFNREAYKNWCDSVNLIIKGLEIIIPKENENYNQCYNLDLWEFFLMYIRTYLPMIPNIKCVNKMIEG